jgi:hypothetical protein
MAVEEVKIKVTADTSDAQDNLKKTEDGLDGVSKSSQKAGNEAKKAGGAFGSIGSALKSLGIISVVVKAFEFFQDILMKNEKVAKFFAVAVEFIERVFSDLVSFLVDNIPQVIDFFKDVFENPTKYIKQLGDAIKKNLIERVESFIDTIGFLGTAIKELFSGNFSAAADAAKSAGKEVFDVLTGVNNVVDKTVEVVGNAADAIVDYTKKTLDAAKAGVELKNAAALAASQAELAAAKFKRQAEEQRQIRDDENRSLDERIEANKNLSKILDQQLKQEESAAQLAVAAAQYELGKNKSIENQIALNQALAALEAKREEITGQRSEQLVNEVALQKEKLELAKAVAAADIKITLDQRKATADLIKDDLEKLRVKRQIAIDEAALEIARLEENVKNTNAGTAARVQAEIELKDKKRAIASEIIAIEDTIATTALNRQLTALEQQATNQQLTFDLRKAALEQEQLLLDDALAKRLISEKDYTEKTKKLSQDRIATEIAEKEAKAAVTNAYIDIVSGAAGLAKSLFEKSKGVQIAGLVVEQAAAVGKIIANLGVANLKAAATSPLTAGQPWIAINTITAGLNIAKAIQGTVKGIQQIRSANASGATAPSAGGGLAVANAAAPVATVQPTAQVATLDQASINRMGQANRAYVVESDITGSQERQARINRAARLA